VRGGETDNLERAFGQAVWRLHATVFQSYDQWATQVRLEPFPEPSIKETWAANLGENPHSPARPHLYFEISGQA
jgi:hypothetical protein